MLTTLINIRFYENAVLVDTFQQSYLPFYPFLVSILYIFIMLPIVLFPSDKKKGEESVSHQKLLFKYDDKTSFTFKKIKEKETETEDIVFIIRQKKDK